MATIAALGLAIAAPIAHAQTPPASTTTPSPGFDQAASNVLTLLQGKAKAADIFNPAFMTAVPEAQLAPVLAGLKAQHGEAQAVVAVRPMDARAASVDIRFDRAIVTFTIGMLDGKLSGLFITGTRTEGDSLDTIMAEIAALPGRTGLIVQKLTDTGAETIVAHNANDRFAIASVFKLYVLAELDRAVRAGERSWSDVLVLSQKSHPSGISQDWPDDAPMTLQTLATLMISVSDNSATDTLIAAIGQERLAAIVRASGHARPSDMIPLLSTQAVTGLKMAANSGVRDRFLAADDAAQTLLLAEAGDVLRLKNLDLSVYTGGPNQIDTIEWFASPADIARLLAMLEREGDQVTRAILRINPGIPPVNAGRWAYLGYKGGSEPGIMGMSFLAASRTGERYIVSALVNNPAAEIDQPGFVTLMARLLDQLAAPATRP
ncbi:beta-lactamase family protein [Blastomonas natatoria]|uniref:Beta-lactamase family protein n=1 Tax=Blastomonas natatoria TaxID=34015 RepID=A0A2V3URL3_9SPHN|nr:serine hydrolase [Blastomonas natatoria]PXW70032.1 beta-lactamase family protein [Blastomonas natatoria]